MPTVWKIILFTWLLFFSNFPGCSFSFFFSLFSSLFKNNLFIYLFIFSCVGSSLLHAGFLQLRQAGLFFVVVRGLLIAVASLVAEHGLQAHGLQQLWLSGSVVVAHGLQSAHSVVVGHGLSCSVACGIFLVQGSNPCPCIGRQILNHCTTREVPPFIFIEIQSTYSSV